MNLGSVDDKAHTLFCRAKDLYLGTKHITIADLADEQLISPQIFGESEFGKKLASVVSAVKTFSLFNRFCEMYQNMLYANKQDIMESVLQEKVGSLKEFGQLMVYRREQDVTEHYP